MSCDPDQSCTRPVGSIVPALAGIWAGVIGFCRWSESDFSGHGGIGQYLDRPGRLAHAWARVGAVRVYLNSNIYFSRFEAMPHN